QAADAKNNARAACRMRGKSARGTPANAVAISGPQHYRTSNRSLRRRRFPLGCRTLGTHWLAMLTINNLSYRIQGRPLFEEASLVLPDGAKAGFVGKNGTGKTTLFQLIQGFISPEQGSIEVNRKARIGAVAQEAVASDVSVLDVVLSA